MSIEKRIAVVKAAQEGQPIQRLDGGEWVDHTQDVATWRYDTSYRIKPEPQRVYRIEFMHGNPAFVDELTLAEVKDKYSGSITSITPFIEEV